MSSYGIFESIEGSEGEKKIATRETQRKLDAAIDDVKAKYGPFLYASRDTEEWEDRVALCKNDMLKTINASLIPATGVVRRIVKACKDDWKKQASRHADKTGPAMDLAETFAPKKDKDLKPKGDFDAYRNKVDQNSDAAVDNCFKEGYRYYYADNGTGAVPQGVAPAGTGEQVIDPVSQAAAVPQGIPGIQASFRYAEFPNEDNLSPEDKAKVRVPGGSPIIPPSSALGQTLGLGSPSSPNSNYHMPTPDHSSLFGGDYAPKGAPKTPAAPSATAPGAPSSPPVPGASGAAPKSPGGAGGGGNTSGGGGGYGGDSGWKANSGGPEIGVGDYKINSGDTLADIAGRASKGDGGMSYQDLAKANNISDPNKINAGDTIHIPGAGGSTPPSPAPAAGAPPTPTPTPPAGGGDVLPPGQSNTQMGQTSPIPKAGSLSLNQYMDWCDSFSARRASINNLDIYAKNLNDQAYFEIASAITDPSSPIYRTAAEEEIGYLDLNPKTKPRHLQDRLNEGADFDWVDGYTPDSRDIKDRSKLKDPASGKLSPGESWGHIASLRTAAPDYLQKSTAEWADEESKKNGEEYQHQLRKKNPGFFQDAEEPIDIPVKKARRKTAAPDYLQKADEALTNLLNQKAEEFQGTIAPLQQALQTVQQAEALQQAQNPMGVQPPAGTVNVLPGGDQGGGAGDGEDPMAAAMALAGGGGDPSMGGGVPPQGDPSQQMMARRRKAIFQTHPSEEAYRRSIEDNQYAERARNAPPVDPPKFSDEDVEYLKGLGQTPDQAGGGFPDWESYHKHHGASRRRQLDALKKAQGANSPKTADVAGAFSKWMNNRGPGAVQGPTDAQDFSEQQGYGQKGQNYLTNHVGPDALLDSAKPQKNPMRQVRGRRKQADFFTRKVAGWTYDNHLSAYVSSKPNPFTCKCGAKIEVPNYIQCRCCGRIINAYVIGSGGDNRQASADKYICREVPLRDNVIVANRHEAAGEENWVPAQFGRSGSKVHWASADENGRLASSAPACGTYTRAGSSGYKSTRPVDCPRCLSYRNAGKSKRHNLSDPGPLDDGKDDKMPTISENLGKEWHRHGPGGKWVANKQRRR